MTLPLDFPLELLLLPPQAVMYKAAPAAAELLRKPRRVNVPCFAESIASSPPRPRLKACPRKDRRPGIWYVAFRNVSIYPRLPEGQASH